MHSVCIHVVKPAWHNLWAVAHINAQLWLQVLHNHVDNQWAIQLHVVQALVLDVRAQGAAGLLGVLQDLLLSILVLATQESFTIPCIAFQQEKPGRRGQLAWRQRDQSIMGRGWTGCAAVDVRLQLLSHITTQHRAQQRKAASMEERCSPDCQGWRLLP